MTDCNKCGNPMFPCDHSIVPALECVNCGRLMPRTGTSHRPKEKHRIELNRMLRAHRRRK